jgi:hypothetical protein
MDLVAPGRYKDRTGVDTPVFLKNAGNSVEIILRPSVAGFFCTPGLIVTGSAALDAFDLGFETLYLYPAFDLDFETLRVFDLRFEALGLETLGFETLDLEDVFTTLRGIFAFYFMLITDTPAIPKINNKYSPTINM